MNEILKYIAEKTDGQTFASHRFCYDTELKLPSLSYDDPHNQDFTMDSEKFGETDTSLIKPKNLLHLAIQVQKEKPLFTFFLDGSRKIYKIDDIEYQKRIFPIVGGQIAVACCEREKPDSFKKTIVESHLVMSLPSLATTGEHNKDLFLNNLVENINKTPKFQKLNIQFSEILTYVSDKTTDIEEYFNRGQAKIQDKMIECEKKVVHDLASKNLLNQDNYLIKDGSLQYAKSNYGVTDFKELAKIANNYRRVIGVSKSFNPEFSKNKKGHSNASVIANLGLYHRTPATKYKSDRVGDVFFSIWYVRIREAQYTASPFAGILKIEKILCTEEERENGLDSSEIDLITANIINERNPVCYGKDQRWANHLYPIYLVESYLKSRYLSDLHFINLF